MTETSKFWLDIVVADIIRAHPEGEIVVSSGHSPSGRYHFGLFREFMTANAITHKLVEMGRQATHIDFVDDFDAFRKVPVGLDSSYEKYLGWPLYLVPSPDKKAGSYADYYLNELYRGVEKAGVKPKVLRAHQEYQAGKFTAVIESTLEKLDEAKAIIKEVSGRDLPDDWSPVQILSEGNSLRELRFTGWDKAKQVVCCQDSNGKDYEVSYLDGRVKLNWRLDWAARWAIWQVGVEPFGRDHASSGGSYDTGKELSRKIFGRPAPYPVPYDFILLAGQTKKMSKSAGNIITLEEILEVMPAELIRYLIAKSKPSKPISFDTGKGLYNLLEEYSKVEEAQLKGENHDFEAAYQVALTGDIKKTISSIPFSHLVASYQTGLGDFDKVATILGRTGYQAVVRKEAAVLKRELGYVKRWLEEYAPDEVKFSVQTKLPRVDLTDDQTSFLEGLARAIDSMSMVDAQAIHDAIYRLKDDYKLAPADAFKAIYKIILNKDYGPKAGWFLASLDKDWLVKRLKLAG